MEGGGSEGERNKTPEGGETKSKRQMKTAAQLEVLEKTYAVESYPSEATRAELSVKLGLSDRQLQMWFCHRRLKDRKPPPVKRQRKDSLAVGDGKAIAITDEMAAREAANEHGPFGQGLDSGRLFPRMGGDILAMKRFNEPSPQLTAELRAIAFVEAQLGEPLREDGPILGMEFDPLPPGAFGAPIETPMHHKLSGQVFETNIFDHRDAKPVKDSVRTIREYQFLPEQPTMRADHYERVSPSQTYGLPVDGPSMVAYANIGTHPIQTVENPFVSSERRIGNEEDVLRMERKRKSDEARMAKEMEAQEKRMRKELEKQDILRRKREDQIRKEIERQDRERRKEEERLLRERQREEERYLKEQRREMIRREKFLLKQSIRAEKMRQKEELRREKEAARLKAASERAIARKMAKESMELIEDERLELMEIAASNMGLASMLSLDFETLQNLDVYRDKLAIFPPKTVQLKKPFAIQPWKGSEDNIGNLLMVWRFLITFIDILGLWPFTLDEFVQAFHDYDPRLLGEIHGALLRTIIKDIEDGARTPSFGLGTNQNTAANPGGGHPQIVEGAYAWGFDIRSWQRHLNALTWPEILRQFALSAGFGPQLKKRNVEQAYLQDDNEANDSENVISNLRNGVAAENAFAIMQERGFSSSRRSKHRLTPGTVKFAAFHVLSLEGDQGLTIMEVAEKIQKSGLRDLTTSKTPEASIAAALSRDTKLFERVAPSTYCVRPPYRKNPADAEAILSEARERIRIFKSGATDGEDVDDAERDEDSDSDVADDPEVDDLGDDLNPKTQNLDAEEAENSNVNTSLANGDGNAEFMQTPKSGIVSVNKGLSSAHSEDLKGKHYIVSGDGIASVDQEACIDESKSGEPWVQGLIEGEYCDLSVEERLNALVALVGIAIEGNTIRIVLEERLEAANALKKQMWADMQLDKRRIKEEFVMRTNYVPYAGSRPEHNPMVPYSESRLIPLVPVTKSNEMSVEPVLQQERLTDGQNDQNYVNSMYSEGNLQMQETAIGPDGFQYQQQNYAAEKERLRAQLKSYIGCKAEEMYMFRSLPLGQDRRRNRYWRFTASASWNDPGCGRIFVELRDGNWRLIDSEEGFDVLFASLDTRGVRESHLHFMLQKIETSFKEAVRSYALHTAKQQESKDSIKTEAIEEGTPESPSSTLCGSDSDITETSTAFKIELGNNVTEKTGALQRYRDFEKWMWESMFSTSALCALKYGTKVSKQLCHVCHYCHDVYYFESTLCQSCQRTSILDKSELHFSEQLSQLQEKLKLDPDFLMHASVSSPLRFRLLKIQLALVEASLPLEAFQPVWTESYRQSWGLKLHSSMSAEEILQVLTLLENAIKRDYLSSNFETTKELLGLSNQFEVPVLDLSVPGSIPVLPWIPKTTSAVALRLFELDSSVAYTPNQKMEIQKDKESADYTILPENTVVRNTQDDEQAETPLRAGYLQETSWGDMGIGFSASGRGRPRGRGRGRVNGGKSQRRVISSRSGSGRKAPTTTNGEGLEQALKPRAPGGRKRGRRSTRSRKRPTKRAFEISNDEENAKDIMSGRSSRGLPTDAWNENDIHELNVEGAEDASSSGRSQYNDEDGQAIGDDYDDMMLADDYAGGSNGLSDKLMDGSDFNLNSEEEDDDGDGGDGMDYGAEYVEGNMNIGGYVNEVSDDEELGNVVPKSFPYDDPALTASSSSDYSD